MSLMAVKRTLTWEETRKHRKFDCPRYFYCLDIASVLGWESFSCEKCSGKDPLPVVYLREYCNRLSDENFCEFDEEIEPYYVEEFTLDL